MVKIIIENNIPSFEKYDIKQQARIADLISRGLLNHEERELYEHIKLKEDQFTIANKLGISHQKVSSRLNGIKRIVRIAMEQDPITCEKYLQKRRRLIGLQHLLKSESGNELERNILRYMTRLITKRFNSDDIRASSEEKRENLTSIDMSNDIRPTLSKKGEISVGDISDKIQLINLFFEVYGDEDLENFEPDDLMNKMRDLEAKSLH